MLTVPTVEELAEFRNELPDDLDMPSVLWHLQAATDLVYFATGLTEDFPADTPEGRMLRNAILDMAWYIGTSMDDREAQYSPFSSERIGSYMYTKALKSVESKSDTGVPFFDLAVKYLADHPNMSSEPSIIMSSTEHVFSQPYGTSDRLYATRVAVPTRQTPVTGSTPPQTGLPEIDGLTEADVPDTTIGLPEISE